MEEWIESALPVGAWLAKHIWRFPENAQPAEDFWDEWSISPEYRITPSLVTTGRTKQVGNVKDLLENDPAILSIQSSSRDESLAFIISAIRQMNTDMQENIFSRCLIVDDPDSFRIIANNRDSFILIPRFEDDGVINRALSRGHHVIIPIGTDSKSLVGDIQVLPRLDREGFIQAFMEMDFSKEDAQKHSKESSRNLTVLRRQLGFVRNQPEWATPSNCREVIPALMLNRWNESKQGDKELLAILAGESYEKYLQKLTKWRNSPDSPVYKIGNNWRLASPLDAWSHLASYLTADDFKTFRAAVLDVIGELNPIFDLEPKKRYMASVYRKERNYSAWAREGISQSLILIAVYGEEFGLETTTIPQHWVDSVMRELFHEASGLKWCSLTDILPLLAEAAPDAFISAVEKSLSEKSQSIMEMFSEHDSVMSPVSYHSGLLWALEGLAWDPEIFSRVVLLLGRLAENDPGGKLQNRPKNSLRYIFLPWLPQTNASLQARLDALTFLNKNQPEVAWELFLDLLPKGQDVGGYTHRTRWREFSEKTRQTPTYGEIWENHSALIDHLIPMAGKVEDEIAKLIEKIPNLLSIHRKKVLEYIDSMVDSTNQIDFSIWNNLRKVLYHHRSHPDTDWCLPDNVLNEIELLYQKLEPEDIITKHKWLFDDFWPKFPEGFNIGQKSHDEEEQKTLEKRLAALKSIYRESGLGSILELAKTAGEPGLVGNTAAHIFKNNEEIDWILSFLQSNNNNQLKFTQSFALRKSIIEGFTWVEMYFEKLKQQQFSTEGLVNFLLPLPQNQQLWKFIESMSDRIKHKYWKKCEIHFYHLPEDVKIYGIKKLQAVDRHISALHVSSHFAKELSSALIIDVLEKTATTPSQESHRFNGHDAITLFEELDKRSDYDVKKLPRLEWFYLPMLVGYGRRNLITLHQELAENPEFFADAIKWAYKSEHDEVEEELDIDSDNVQYRAQQAYELLDSWKLIPGTEGSSIINSNFLHEWITKARELCEEDGRLEPADSHIGQVFANYPEENDTWPPKPLCEIIDSMNSERMKKGFYIGIKNKRSFSSRSPFEGGNRERNLAKHFRELSSKIASKYLVTASVLKDVARSYEIKAKRIDVEAEQRDMEY